MTVYSRSSPNPNSIPRGMVRVHRIDLMHVTALRVRQRCCVRRCGYSCIRPSTMVMVIGRAARHAGRGESLQRDGQQQQIHQHPM